ncbi:MAG: tRNA-dihydrouridine synthase [Phycisphaerae bacterium]|nr:tRNA-dihydrouridine synthase [Phycisphaerae bacterium]
MNISALKPFRIGDIEIDFPVVLAPLAGYSDLPYRRLCRRLGAPYCTTEMMLDRCVAIQSRQQMALIATDEDDHPVAGQLIGNDPAVMAEAARLLADKGFDVIDLNFACPVNKAMRRKRGGFLMSKPHLAVEITRAVVEAVDRPVTIKVRQRFADDDSEENFWILAEGARQAGAVAVTVHARSVAQKYQGVADWDFLKRAKAGLADWTVIGSGDCLRPQDALAMLEQTGVDAAAVARGVLGNPWFFRQVRDLTEGNQPYQPSLIEQRELMLEHFDMAMKLYSPRKAPAFMRKFGIKYSRMHPQPKRIRMAFVGVKCPEDWQKVLDEYYPKR